MYVMESKHESARLESKTISTRDEQHLTLVGLKPGMRVLDACGGTGAAARTIARLVGPTGHVTVLDMSNDRLNVGRKLARDECISNVSFVQGNLTDEIFAPGTFDFVWCRFAIEYMSDPQEAVYQLVRNTRIGGKIAVGDLDNNGTAWYPQNPIVENGIQKVLRCIDGQFDPFAGRKLVNYVHKTGAKIDNVHVLPYHVHAGNLLAVDVYNWKSKLETLRALCSTEFSVGEYDEFSNEFMKHLQAPGTFMYSTLVFVEATKISS